jgi:hypothetical protein
MLIHELYTFQMFGTLVHISYIMFKVTIKQTDRIESIYTFTTRKIQYLHG